MLYSVNEQDYLLLPYGYFGVSFRSRWRAAGPQVSCMHIGPYSQCEPAYNALMDWIPANGHTSTGVYYEYYLNDPADTPESELLTKIVAMLK